MRVCKMAITCDKCNFCRFGCKRSKCDEYVETSGVSLILIITRLATGSISPSTVIEVNEEWTPYFIRRDVYHCVLSHPSTKMVDLYTAFGCTKFTLPSRITILFGINAAENKLIGQVKQRSF